MIRALLTASALTVLMAVPAMAMDCEKEFRVRIDQMMSKQTISFADKVEITRFTLQGAEACMKGDKAAAQSFFEKAAKMGG